ncbi:MAG: tRNA pseudouridine(38-40) synthase TruA, partial [Bacteroidaceae bacterium]|nr:tRNA pseudouridine(38-40) synthase TruA [Bacteroidaceae bacterium]
MRYFIYLSYDGARYHGWQIQPNGISVQEVLNKALSTLLHEPVKVTGAGRTDAGVNASLMVAHFDTTRAIDDNLCYRLNKFVPSDIAIHRILPVKDDAHARFSATSRTYHYYIITEKSPFEPYAYRFPQPLDFNLMNEAAKALFDYTDFTSFSKLHTDVKTNNCKIMQARWQDTGRQLVFTI